MASVWKRLQRVNKKASKFQFVASYQELVLECTKKWQPDKLRVVWTRRNRRMCSKLHSWQPGIKNPYRGMVVWPVPENIDISVTLFKDPNADEFEDKEWTFVIEGESKGHRKVLASADINLRRFASPTPTQTDLTLTLKPLSVKVVEATLKLSLSCVFVREGKATDEDMQSLASLMSVKPADIGNLDDFNESDEEEDKRSVTPTGPALSLTQVDKDKSKGKDSPLSEQAAANSRRSEQAVRPAFDAKLVLADNKARAGKSSSHVEDAAETETAMKEQHQPTTATDSEAPHITPSAAQPGSPHVQEEPAALEEPVVQPATALDLPAKAEEQAAPVPEERPPSTPETQHQADVVVDGQEGVVSSEELVCEAEQQLWAAVEETAAETGGEPGMESSESSEQKEEKQKEEEEEVVIGG